MKPLRLLFFLLVVAVSFAFSQNCQIASAVPAGQSKLGSGRVILDDDGVVSLGGGPEVYTRIKNVSAADITYWVAVETFKQDTKTYATNCLYRATLAPKSSVVVSGSSSAELPILWRVSVTMGPEVDEEVRVYGLSFEVYSRPPNPKKTSDKQ